MSTSHKGQISFEFLIFFSVALVFFMTMLLIISDQNSKSLDRSEQFKLDLIAEQISREVFLANSVQSGYYREFSLPSKVGSKDYTVDLINNTVFVRTDEKESFSFVFNVEGSLNITSNVIRKDNGSVIIN